MKKSFKLTVTFFIVAVMILEISTFFIPMDQLSSSAATYESQSDTKIINESQVIHRFNEIKTMKYDEVNMNCKNKSELFASYLKSIGATGIYLVTVKHGSGTYSHEFVEWNGHYYDTCSSDTSYEIPMEEYSKKLYQLGFTGISVTSPYQ
ncbi:MAG: hypothetical protein NKF70_09325 [Methanobacterium sp. ERen5]|nr:MAG: hypothetical protein NKF70_09325 [Methanobacterium sp. ERen5]